MKCVSDNLLIDLTLMMYKNCFLLSDYYIFIPNIHSSHCKGNVRSNDTLNHNLSVVSRTLRAALKVILCI